MNPRIKKLWVADLRAHPELQGKSRLRVGDTYCCLGRLCEVYRKETGKGRWRKIKGETVFKFLGNSALLPREVVVWAGLPEGPEQDNPKVGVDNLTACNDTGKTFPEIADLIEKHL